MARISASGVNSAAFDKKDHLYAWGHAGYGKMCSTDTQKNIDTPKNLQFKTEKSKELVELVPTNMGFEEKKRKNDDDENEVVERVSKFKSIRWGDYHCLMLDKKG